MQVVADNPLSKLTGIYQTEVLRMLVGPVHSQVGVKMYPHSYPTLHLFSIIPEGSWGAFLQQDVWL